ncbi:GNAT family N-acetyltransferase [Solirubrobacter sp. CPCC 204708]|uniref:GNAT family N-acetyltransferase n=1 Tax=Solirubrobacter deserti TaxID=2282478 RepID=A0ABT4RBT2_9ACTN|nr:GNAT family N-acetyltransferase [Solirubrobacter deserti]MBE2317124.1 GNAT family N-acetyltransferase [Solirubrobacter deserti]MDA0135984.1 GNAT family N-acetyltransferase [Solirubrobacter deserti]
MLERIEAYYDAVPRSAARAEEIGPFTLFVPTGAWPYYARPRLGLEHAFTGAEVEAVRARQRELGVPEAFEWVHDTTPSLLAVMPLDVMQAPLMVLRGAVPAAAPEGVTVRMIEADDPLLSAAVAAQDRGFGGSGEDVGDRVDFLRERLASGITRMAIATIGEDVVAVGQHQPVADVTEIVGVATVPEARRRGIAGALTARLVEDAAADIVFLSAGEDAARVYARLGFERHGTACIAG